MKLFWENVKFFIGAHKAASIAVAGVVGVSAVGAGGYGVYNLLTDEEEEVIQEAEVTEEAAAENVYIPEFANVVISSESLEKDLTIYISDENDNAVTGVPFQVKLLKPEVAEGLQSYIDSINEINTQIVEATASYSTDSEADVEAEEKEDGEEDGENAGEETESTAVSDPDAVLDILKSRNVDITITDENGDVVETQKGDISSDPLYLLYLDKETAVQSFALALREAEGEIYTDEDVDGVITEKEMEPGDYVACILNDFDNEKIYEPTTYATPVNVKDKVEYKVQKEITKQIKKDVAAEDQQPKAAAPVENVLKDTVEWVESRRVENGATAHAVAGTDVVAPKTTASASKATLKDKGVTVLTHTVAHEPSKFRIVYNYQLQDVNGNNVGGAQEITHEDLPKDAMPTYNSPDKEKVVNNIKYILTTKPTYEKVTAAKTYTFVYKAEKTEEKPEEKQEEKKAEKKTFTITIKYKLIKTDGTEKEINIKELPVEEGSTPSFTPDKEYKHGDVTYEIESTASPTIGEANDDATYTFYYKQKVESTESTFRLKRNQTVATSFTIRDRLLAARVRTIATNVATSSQETAKLDMTYSAGVFTIVSTNNVSGVAVNGTAVSMKDGKGTFNASANGDYKLTGTAKWSDPKTEAMYVVYTVSGFGTASTERLKDKAGNELFVDEALTKPATAADYNKDRTFYYKEASYTYYGWQTISGASYYYDKNGNKVTGEQVILGVKYNFGPDGALLVKGSGIDVSKYQGNIDWNQAKSAVNFAIVRCGYRGQNDGLLHEDPYFYKNMKGARDAGVATGVYIFSRALNEAEAVQEASMAVAMAQKAGGCAYPIFIDMEDTTRGVSNLPNAQKVAIVNAFISTVQSSGYKAGVYCSKNWMTQRMDASAINSSAYIWIAQYNTSCTYQGKYSIWQYSSKGSVPGIKGYVDMNKSFF